MNLTLFRKTEIDDTVLGELHINNKFFCYTLEDKIRDVKIKHHTCIPSGKYQIVMTLSQRFKTILPLLLKVPNFEGIRIHAGNTIEDTSGCLLVGSAVNGKKLLHSKTTLQKLMSLLRNGLKSNYVFIEIHNPIKNVNIEPVQVVSDIQTKPIAEPIVEAIVETIPEINNQKSVSNIIIIFNQLLKWLIKYF